MTINCRNENAAGDEAGGVGRERKSERDVVQVRVGAGRRWRRGEDHVVRRSVGVVAVDLAEVVVLEEVEDAVDEVLDPDDGPRR